MKLNDFLKTLSETMDRSFDYLTEMDGVVGDGDLGITMRDGFKAAYVFDSSSSEKDLGKRLFGAGKAMGNAVPSTMGTLMAKGFMEAGKRLREETELDTKNIVTMAEGYYSGVQALGKALPGEKTFLDGFYPGLSVLKEKSQILSETELYEQAYRESQRGFNEATQMLAKHGRAATRGEKSIGIEDPGAAVAVLWFESLKNTPKHK